MFTRKHKILSLIFLACITAIMTYPAILSAQTASRPATARNNAETVPLSFTNADIATFTDQMADLLGLRPILVDSAIQGTVDLTETIPRNDLWILFNAILKSRNAALVKHDNIYQIIPVNLAIRYNLETIEEQPAPNTDETSAAVSPIRPAPDSGRTQEDSRTVRVATHVIRLDFVPVEDVQEAARLFLSDGAPIITYKRQNLMIITDYSDNAARVRELVRMLDDAYLDRDRIALVEIKNSNVVDIADELKKIFASSATDNAATGVSFLPIERLNAIFVTAGTKRGLSEARRWIEELDTYTGGKFQTFVYVVKESTALSIASQLSALYGDDGTGSSSRGSSNTRNTQGTSGSRSGSSASSLLNQTLGSSGSDGSFGSSSQLGPRLSNSSAGITSIVLPGGGTFSNIRDESRVVVDEINNVLRIQSTPADYRFLISAIEEMDIPPRQVIIDLEIYQVDLTNDLAYGFSAVLEKLGEETNMTTGGLNLSPSGDSRPAFRTFTNLGKRQIILELEALKTKTNVKILQNPKLSAMDGTEAHFVSGAEVPYPTENVYSGNYASTGMSYRETGVNLKVIPRISASGMVLMEIVQEVSSVSERTVSGLSAPIFPLTQVTTTLFVKDGETVAMAGLISETNTWGRAGIPFLSDIPFVGGLFGATSNNNTRTEMIILITPHVIRNQNRFQDITQGLLDSLPNVRRLADERDAKRISDIEDARGDREKKELSDIKKVKKSK